MDHINWYHPSSPGSLSCMPLHNSNTRFSVMDARTSALDAPALSDFLETKLAVFFEQFGCEMACTSSGGSSSEIDPAPPVILTDHSDPRDSDVHRTLRRDLYDRGGPTPRHRWQRRINLFLCGEHPLAWIYKVE